MWPLTQKLTIGTRGSQLALWQTNWVKAELEKRRPGITIEVQVISTKGDRVLDISLPKLGEQGKGLFTKELEDAIFEHRVDLAVHSLKDLPTELPAGLHIGAICEREDVRDALVARADIKSFSKLPEGARIGTSSLRRQAQLRAVRPDLMIEPVRGNVDTRLRKLDEGQYDAVVLAAAGLHRLGHGNRITEHLSEVLMLPAVGQGALAIETREDDAATAAIIQGLNHQATRLACQAERAFLKRLGGGCLVPIAAYARIDSDVMTLTGLVASPDGSEAMRDERSGPSLDPELIGEQLADEMLSRGAAKILTAFRYIVSSLLIAISSLVLLPGVTRSQAPPSLGAGGAGLRTGVLPRSWATGGPKCVEISEFQVHEYNEDLYILRQSGCSHYEKPFLYLLFGGDKALLLDTGAGKTEVARVVRNIIDKWLARNKRESIQLIVAHTHAHGDHISGDDQFKTVPQVVLIPPNLKAVQSFFGIKNWPEEITQYALGDRIIDVIPIPGHEVTSIALYDRQTGILFTGDTLYPGRLYVEDPMEYIRSIERLVHFTQEKLVTHILGNHIENTRTPYLDYPIRTTYQPDEHALELGRAQLLELYDALQKMHGKIVRTAIRDFTIWPVYK